MISMYKTLLLCALLLPLSVGAQETTKNPLSDRDKSLFQQKAEIVIPQRTVPIVVDVEVPFAPATPDTHVVVDNATAVPQPSIVMTRRKKQGVTFDVSTKNKQIRSPQAMFDGSVETFAEFPFSERYDAKGRIIAQTAIFDVVASRPIDTDGFTINVGPHITLPQSIRVSAIQDDGSERLLLPRKNVYNAHVSFPRITADHFRIEITYRDVLRIHEIFFKEFGAPISQVEHVRFIAQPGASYSIYYNADHYVKIDAGETPQLQRESRPTRATLTPMRNDFYHMADTDDDGVNDANDNCVTTPNPDQIDKDTNGIGDACEDFDRDGIINQKDNCPNVPNRAQKDIDADGVGDVCDDTENRFLARYPWLPTATIILVGAIVVMLIVLTLKKK